MNFIELSVLWIIWCFVHSLLISIYVTKKARLVLKGHYKYYRLFYNFFSLISFILLVLYTDSVHGPLIFGWYGSLTLIQAMLLLLSIFLFLSGFKHYDLLLFLGIRQAVDSSSSKSLSATNQIDTSGILSVTRHPWYLATFIFIWVNFTEMYLSTLIVRIILSAYLIIGTILEENKLVYEYGEEYKNYQSKVSMMFPFKWIVSIFQNK